MASSPTLLCPHPSLPAGILTELSPLFLCVLNRAILPLPILFLVFLSYLVCLQKCLRETYFHTLFYLPDPSNVIISFHRPRILRNHYLQQVSRFVVTLVCMCISPTRLVKSRTMFYFRPIFSTPGTKLRVQQVLNKCFWNEYKNGLIVFFLPFFFPSFHLSIHRTPATTVNTVASYSQHNVVSYSDGVPGATN